MDDELERLKDLAEKAPDITETYAYRTFMQNYGSYSKRKVARYDGDGWFISTALVYDAEGPQYETAIVHPEYNEGEHVIVEVYSTEEKAEEGHERWVEVMTAGELPDELVDVYLSPVKHVRGQEAPWRKLIRDLRDMQKLRKAR